MQKFKPYISTFSVFLGCLFLLFSCQNTTKKENKIVGIVQEEVNDLSAILKKKKLVVLAENSTISYFIYKGTKMGLEYEILHSFAKELGVQLEVKIVKDLDDMIPMLNNGEGDLIACNYTITNSRKKSIAFSNPIMRTPQVLIQKKPEDWRERTQKDWKRDVITSPEQLSRKTVHVWENSSYYKRMTHLQNELGDTILIQPLSGQIIPEKAMEMVDKGFIDYTVLDQNVAQINYYFYPDLDIDLELSIKQKIAFGLRQNNPQLRNKLNDWLDDFLQTPRYRYISHKYLNTRTYSRLAKSPYSTISGGKISEFDDIIKQASAKYNWDWRLVAAVIYQESKFMLNQESWAGAYGLMQFMPTVGPVYGVYPDSPPDVQIDGGVRKLNRNYNDWKEVPDSTQRMKFALGTYNAGLGHILDAQRLAVKYGKDPLVWDNNVERYVRKLMEPQYYTDEVVRYGYLRGTQTYHYVRSIMTQFNEYKTAFPEDLGDDIAS